ncbi:MAG: hypothetical protein C0582_03615 [Alphaproteobacteria bacterium]|nr:MAG: hypothetical protein C0582_03615 [Alphaproteobacteria bacterium]
MIQAKMLNTFFKATVKISYYFVVFIMLVFLTLFIRLQISPIDITSIAKKSSLLEGLKSGQILIKWQSLSFNPQIKFEDISLKKPSFDIQASASVWLSMQNLLIGRIKFSNVKVKDIQIQMDHLPVDAGTEEKKTLYDALFWVAEKTNLELLSRFQALTVKDGTIILPSNELSITKIEKLTLSFQESPNHLDIGFRINDQALSLSLQGDALKNGQTLKINGDNIKDIIPTILEKNEFLKPGLFEGQTKTGFEVELKQENKHFNVAAQISHQTTHDKRKHTYQGSFDAKVGPESAPYEAHLRIISITLDKLSDIWPEDIAPNAQKWLTKNLSEGVLNDGYVWIQGQASLDPKEPLTVDKIKGHLTLDRTTINYLDNMPQIKDARATGFFNESGFDIAINQGHINETQIKFGHMRITNILSERPMADLYVKISSPLKSLLEVINTEPLALLKKYDFDIDHAEGAVLATLKMGFPLLKDVEFKDFDLDVEAHLKKAYIKKLTPQHPFVLSEGTYDLTIKSDELTMTGDTLLNGLPADFTWHSYFYPTRTYKNHYLFKCTAKLKEIPETDLSAYDQYVPGLIGFDLAIKELVNNEVNVSLKATLDKTDVNLPILGKIKTESDPGFLYAHLIFMKGHLRNISELKYADESGEIELEGTFDKDGSFKIDVRDVSVLKNKFQGSITSSKKEGLTVHVKGPFIDLSSYQSTKSKKEEKPSFSFPKKMLLALGFEKVFMKNSIVMENFSSTLNIEDDFLTYGHAKGTFYNKNQFKFQLLKNGNKQKLDFYTDNLGLLTRGLGLTTEIYGGKIDMKGTRDLPASLKTSIKITDLTMKNIPSIVRILSLASLSGVSQIFQGPGYVFTDGFIDCNYENNKIYIINSLLNGSGIAISAAGYLDFGRDLMNLTGQVVPFRSINQFLGAIPLIGTVLSGGTPDHGIFSFSYQAKGPLGAPDISSNPLSIFTPQTIKGLMREDAYEGEKDLPDVQKDQKEKDV